MRILLLCNKLPYPSNDGSSIAIARMIEGYVAAGVELTVLSLNTKKHFKDPEFIPKKVQDSMRLEIVEVDTNPTVGNAFVNLFQRLPFHVSRFFQKPVASRLEDLLDQQDYDIVQCEGIFMMPYKRIVWKKSSAKVVLRAHNIEHRIWERTTHEETKPVLKAFLKVQSTKLKRYEIYCATKANAILPISPVDATFFAQFNTHVHTMPCGIDHVEPLKTLNTSSFFHLGAMDWLPNQLSIHWLLKDVWPKVHAENNALTLHLAGRAMSDEFKNQKIPGVQIHGEIDDARAFRSNHGVMLVPLQAGSGMRVKIIEGLAEGIPIISTRIGAEGIDVEDGKHVVLADDADAFARAMLKLANHEQTCIEIGKNAATLAAEKYLNQSLVADLVGYYKETWQIS
jgi:glycosyltransferase involved in cell wall biosynthesis